MTAPRSGARPSGAPAPDAANDASAPGEPAAGDPGEVFARCSFCGRPNTEVRRLIAGPGVRICDACVGACTAILDAHADAGDHPPARLPEWGGMDDDEMLGHIGRIAATGAQVDASLREWVGELRARSVSWSRIGAALGTTRQAAWERFA